jgi:hypothetical protein
MDPTRTPPPSRAVRPHAALAPDPRGVLITAASVLAVATIGMLFGIEPIASWYYSLAWYPTIAIADALARRRDSTTPMLLARPGVLFGLMAWSAVVWFTFELWNLRLANWYYVNVPDERLLRWPGTVLAFATVLPGIFAFERLFATHRIGEGLHTPRFPLSARTLNVILGVGVVSAVLVLAWPRLFFPLVWGVTFFLIAPLNCRLGGRSLLSDVSQGRWGRVVRLLLAGAVCGFLWELFNIRARAKWIYTVPGLEDLKLFEMPLLGFIGFPVFALECYEMYRAAVLLGVAPEWEMPAADLGRPRRRSFLALTGVVTAAIGLVIGSLALIDRFTVDSMTPRPAHLPAVSAGLAGRLHDRGIDDVREMPALLANPTATAALGIGEEERKVMAEQVELALLRGIGSRNAARLASIGVDGVEDLALSDEKALARWMVAADRSYRPRPERLRVWVAAARDQVARTAAER